MYAWAQQDPRERSRAPYRLSDCTWLGEQGAGWLHPLGGTGVGRALQLLPKFLPGKQPQGMTSLRTSAGPAPTASPQQGLRVVGAYCICRAAPCASGRGRRAGAFCWTGRPGFSGTTSSHAGALPGLALLRAAWESCVLCGDRSGLPAEALTFPSTSTPERPGLAHSVCITGQADATFPGCGLGRPLLFRCTSVPGFSFGTKLVSGRPPHGLSFLASYKKWSPDSALWNSFLGIFDS